MTQLLFKTSDNLKITLTKKELNLLLDLAQKNFFNFIFEHTDTVFYKENSVSHFGIFTTKEHTLMSYEEALKVYETKGFHEVVEKLDNRKYFTIFTNYRLISKFNHQDLIQILVYDFKLLLFIADITEEEFLELINGT